jgi:hypothetical protein
MNYSAYYPTVSNVTQIPNPNAAQNYSWIDINNDQNRPLFAQATYKVNSLGSNGITIIATTNTVTGNFAAIQTIVATTFSGLTGTNGVSVSAINIPTFPASFTISGSFAAIKIASGSIVAYNA